MAYDEELADRVRFLLGATTATEKRMFGGLAFLIGGHLAVAASRSGGLMVRVDPTDTEELVASTAATRMVMRGREMDGWLLVDAGAVDADGDLRSWVDRGVDFVRTLPAKEPGRRR